MSTLIRIGEWITDTDGRTAVALAVLGIMRLMALGVQYVLMSLGLLWLLECL